MLSPRLDRLPSLRNPGSKLGSLELFDTHIPAILSELIYVPLAANQTLAG